MCVAVPGLIIERRDGGGMSAPAVIEAGGRTIEADLVMVPEARVGDYVVCHSGYAIRVLSPEQATEAMAVLGD